MIDGTTTTTKVVTDTTHLAPLIGQPAGTKTTTVGTCLMIAPPNSRGDPSATTNATDPIRIRATGNPTVDPRMNDPLKHLDRFKVNPTEQQAVGLLHRTGGPIASLLATVKDLSSNSVKLCMAGW